MKIDEKTIEKMFEEWVSDSSNLTSEEVKNFREMNEKDRIRFALANGFKAAINLLLPIIQKQDEAISFYASTKECWDEFTRSNDKGISFYGREDDISLADVIGSKGLYQAHHYGKLARSTKQEVSDMIKRLGGEG